MMCDCEEAFARRFLSHQLREGSELETRRRVPVTAGFLPRICAVCRGLPAEPAPAAEIHGRTSKIKRYYWRELIFGETSRRADWDAAHPAATEAGRRSAHRAIDAEVLAEIKRLHETSPKYVIAEPSQSDVLKRCGVEPISLVVEHVEGGGRGAVIRDGDKAISPEAFVTAHYERHGWSVLRLESVPFHALFGVMMWMLIQDFADPLGQMSGFGDRDASEAGQTAAPIWTTLPQDFGGRGYAQRRRRPLQRHLKSLVGGREELLFLFDLWREPSRNLRQYLWAHRPADVDRARRLIELLEPDLIRRILVYLVEDYWERYLGWPDLLVHRGDAVRFVEVKSSGDKLGQEQKRWIADNHDQLHIPFELVKLHRVSGQSGARP